ncbi:AMIN-like domain-containing (lipo)protein [Vallicoccus soli]|uniref:AMIN-like domain-containing protein n=1 Tax=Vallicoccus soli TaxID=2339232 RepID=A0A3A3YVH6_9ACTN|nr:hypothetical protein [Vallicoccus soli]RJK94769.1 hypothetical protein D5H78_13120 [Vallicoccus soli]
MTDPRDALRGAGGPPADDPDLAAVHARAGRLRRRRRAATAAGTTAVLVAVVGAGALVLGPGDDRGGTVVAVPTATAPATPTGTPTGTPSGTPAPTTAPTPDPPATPDGPGQDDEPDDEPDGEPDGDPDGDPDGGPPFPADTRDDTAELQGGGGLTVTDIRTGRQDGYDRVVYELEGPAGALPGWRVGYVDEALQEFSGAPVPLAGGAALQVLLTGIANEPPAGLEPFTGRRLPGDTALVREVVTTGAFEGEAQSFVGLDAEAPFRVTLLEDPARVVVDVVAP